ncbi:MAG: PEP-CTERM sorting domain-containing protein [Limisphaerales bacterium]
MILLPGSILMAVALPLYADFSNPGYVTLDHPPVTLHWQIASSLVNGTDHFSILDTRRQLNPESVSVTGSAILAPAFKMSSPAVPVPEPTHYVLMGLGVLGLFLARRDRLSAR